MTVPNAPIKIAYVSTFEPAVYIEQCNIRVVNGTGSVSGNQGQLALSLQDANDCRHARFMCQLEYLQETYSYNQGNYYYYRSEPGIIKVDPVPRDFCSAGKIVLCTFYMYCVRSICIVYILYYYVRSSCIVYIYICFCGGGGLRGAGYLCEKKET